jgi:hypothetical protein
MTERRIGRGVGGILITIVCFTVPDFCVRSYFCLTKHANWWHEMEAHFICSIQFWSHLQAEIVHIECVFVHLHTGGKSITRLTVTLSSDSEMLRKFNTSLDLQPSIADVYRPCQGPYTLLDFK